MQFGGRLNSWEFSYMYQRPPQPPKLETCFKRCKLSNSGIPEFIVPQEHFSSVNGYAMWERKERTMSKQSFRGQRSQAGA